MGYKFVTKGDWSKTQEFLNNIIGRKYLNVLSKYGHIGVQALSAATPVDTGKTAASWNYEIHQEKSSNTLSLVFTNSNVNNGVPIAILIQYGHGTGTGGYVQGIDYINPALALIFNQLADEVWKEVTE